MTDAPNTPSEREATDIVERLGEFVATGAGLNPYWAAGALAKITVLRAERDHLRDLQGRTAMERDQYDAICQQFAGDLAALRARLGAAEGVLKQIAKAKPERVAEGFVQGSATLWAWAQRIARAYFAAQPADQGEG